MAFSDKAPDPSITPNTYDAALAIIDASERDILSAPDFQTLNALSVDAEIALGIIEASRLVRPTPLLSMISLR